MIHLDNVVVLGLAVPEQIRDGRKTVCVAAYHEDLGLIRIYPCRADMGLSRWQQISVDLERNPSDTRYESFKLVGAKQQWDMLSQTVTTHGKINKAQRLELLGKLQTTCVNDINTARFSLGIIKPYAMHDVWLDNNPTHLKPHQARMGVVDRDGWIQTKSDYPHQPRIAYQCSPGCKGHNQTILEWGAFEWMRTHPNNPQQLIENWRLHDEMYEHYLVVGNQAQHRNSFLVINVLWFKREQAKLPSLRQPQLFDVAA